MSFIDFQEWQLLSRKTDKAKVFTVNLVAV